MAGTQSASPPPCHASSLVLYRAHTRDERVPDGPSPASFILPRPVTRYAGWESVFEGGESPLGERQGSGWIAACGLDCEACSIRRLPFDEAAAKTCADWYREMGWLKPTEGRDEAVERGMYCNGCKEDRTVHWSVDEDGTVSCWILACCVDAKGLDHCSDCGEFPCDRLVDWSKEKEGYSKALERLASMHQEGDWTGDSDMTDVAPA